MDHSTRREIILNGIRRRDRYLSGLGLKVLRFDSRVVLTETDAVLEVIYKETKERLGLEIPPTPL